MVATLILLALVVIGLMGMLLFKGAFRNRCVADATGALLVWGEGDLARDDIMCGAYLGPGEVPAGAAEDGYDRLCGQTECLPRLAPHGARPGTAVLPSPVERGCVSPASRDFNVPFAFGLA